MIKKHLNTLQTPCFILDRNELTQNITGFQTALSKYFSSSILGYSVKTNALPAVLQIARQYNIYAEIVSSDEYDLAKLCGYQIDHIIYNGPMKTKETFLEAIEQGAIVNIETFRELQWLSCLDQKRSYNVGIRLNIDLDILDDEDLKEDEKYSRFGFCTHSGEFERALDILQQYPHISLSGLHLHRTSKTRSINVYQAICNWVAVIINKYTLRLDYLDMGGGFYGAMPGKPTYEEYVSAIYETLKQYDLHNLQVILEPGNAIIASPISFLSSVIDVKRVKNSDIITTDGSRNDIDPFYNKTSYFHEMILKDDNKREISPMQVVSGCTCLEFDRMFELQGTPHLMEGDKILYKYVGAYTMCLSPMFIRYLPSVYLKSDDQYILIREPWSAEEQMIKSIEVKGV